MVSGPWPVYFSMWLHPRRRLARRPSFLFGSRGCLPEWSRISISNQVVFINSGNGTYMVYFVEEAVLLRYIIYEPLGDLAAATALEADPLIEGKIEEISEDNVHSRLRPVR